MESLNTKIIATISPTSLEVLIFQELISAGIDYIRINASYGDIDQYN